MPELPVLSCDGCGVCCGNLSLPPFLVDFFTPENRNDEFDAFKRGWPGLAAELRAEHERRAAEDDWPESGPCLWFDPETKGCRHYEARPEICRSFRLGGPSCVQQREAAGILPPFPTPIVEPPGTAMARVAGRERAVLEEVVYRLFGDPGDDVLLPDLPPGPGEASDAIAYLREQLWPGRFPTGDAPADADYDDTPRPASFTCRGWTVEEAIDALMAYDQGCTDSGVRDADMKEAVRGHLGGMVPAALASFVAEFVEEHYESDAARRAGYGPDDAAAFREWLRDGLGLSLPPAPPA